MAEYRKGDRVLVEAVVLNDWNESEAIQLRVSTNLPVYVKEKDIHGLAPKPETDWSKVEFGARVRNCHGQMLRFIDAGSLMHPNSTLDLRLFCPKTKAINYANSDYCELIEDE